MPKRNDIHQHVLELMGNVDLLHQRVKVLNLIKDNQFDQVIIYNGSEVVSLSQDKIAEIQHILDLAPAHEQIFIKNYYNLPRELKEDLKINLRAIEKNPYIYFLLDFKTRYLNDHAYAFALMKTAGRFFKYLSRDLQYSERIKMAAVVNDPSVIKDLYHPAASLIPPNFIKKALHLNPLIYTQLELYDREDPLFIDIVIKDNLFPDESIFKAIPRSKRESQASILNIIANQHYYFRFLSFKHRSDIKIATYAIKNDYALLKFVPKKLHLNKDILLAFFLENYDLCDDLLDQYMFYTNSKISPEDFVNRLIKVCPNNEMMKLARYCSSLTYPPIFSKSLILEFLKKEPQTYKYLLDFVHLREISTPYFSAIAVLALKLDYKNFRYITLRPFVNHPDSFELDKDIYTKLFEVCIKYYKSNGEKGSHPYKWAHKKITLKDAKKIITKKINNKTVIDYQTIFIFGPTRYKKIKEVYVNALNADPKLAKYFPLNKKTQISTFEGLNKEALEVLFPLWVRFLKTKDVLEIAHLKNEILKPATQSVVKVS